MLELKSPFVLAPLAGITDKTMRSLCSEQGASLTYTEMVSAKGLWYGDKNTERLLEIGSGEGPVAFQIFGSEPEIMESAVWCLCMGERMKRGEIIDDREFELADLNFAEIDAGRRPLPALIDLNAGCPVPKIVRNGEGSALLKDIDKLYDVASAMVRGSKAARDQKIIQAQGRALLTGAMNTGAGKEKAIPVTAKIRIGFTRGENVAVEVAKALEAAGVSAITVHGRTREQYYEGKADWQAIADVKQSVKIPVIGNGDVKTGADAMRMLEETGCDGVMIARGALGNPWIFREAVSLWEGSDFMPPTQEERINMLIRHIDMVTADKGEDIGVKEMRKHIAWYTKGMRGATAVRRAVNQINKADPLKQEIRRILP